MGRHLCILNLRDSPMLIRYRNTTQAQMLKTRTPESDLGISKTSLRLVSGSAGEQTDCGCAAYPEWRLRRKPRYEGVYQRAWEDHIICTAKRSIPLSACQLDQHVRTRGLFLRLYGALKYLSRRSSWLYLTPIVA
jgi:hypothetical protein